MKIVGFWTSLIDTESLKEKLTRWEEGKGKKTRD